MEILKNFNDDTFELIADNETYTLPESLGANDVIKLTVSSDGGSYQADYLLEQNKDFYIKNQQIFLKPNEVLDRNNFSEGNYSLQFDFLKRWQYADNSFYISEISPSRKELRLKLNPPGSGPIFDELVDSGMDTAGVENALGILKQISRERHKNIYLISHRDELQGRVNNVLKVTKEGGFTSYAFVDNS